MLHAGATAANTVGKGDISVIETKCRFCGSEDGGRDGICLQCVDELSPTCECTGCWMPASRTLNGRAVCDGCYERLTQKRKVGVA